MKKEVGVGVLVGVLLFLAWEGFNVFPIIFLGAVGVAMYFLVNANMKVTNSKYAEIASASKSSLTSFQDIGGQKMAQNELKEALEFIRQAEKVKKMGIRPLKGILLTGPPGTGKTLLAKAAANYTDSVFIAASGSEFVEMYAGVGAQRIRKLFKSAYESAKKKSKNNAIIFIDEIEVICGKRGRHTSHNEYDQTLNQLLVEMDGMTGNDEVRILLIGATNRVDILDPAILRPGRFDRIVKVDLPDKEGRKQILQIHVRNKPLAPDVDLDKIAQETFGFSGAHLESLANEAAILSMRESSELISQRHFIEAIDKVMMGEKMDRKPTKEELRRIAVHEVGHGILSEINRPGSVASITIVSRGNALGYMRQTPADDTYLYTKEEIEQQIAQLLAGSLAEEMIFGSRSTGAGNDFQETLRLSKQIILAGMSRLGIVSEELIEKTKCQEVMTEIIEGQEETVRSVLQSRKEQLLTIVDYLMENEAISGEAFRAQLRKSERDVA